MKRQVSLNVASELVEKLRYIADTKDVPLEELLTQCIEKELAELEDHLESKESCE